MATSTFDEPNDETRANPNPLALVRRVTMLAFLAIVHLVLVNRTQPPGLLRTLLSDTNSLVRLRALHVMELQPGERVRGVAGDRHGRVLYWGQSRVWLSDPNTARIEVCPAKRNAVRTAFFASPSTTIGLIESDSRLVLQTRAGKPCFAWFKLPPLSGKLVAGAWENGQLLLLTLGTSGGLLLSVVDTAGRIRRSQSISVKPDLGETLEWTYLGRTDRGIIVGSHRLPAWWILFDDAHKVSLSSPGLSSDQLASVGIRSAPSEVYASPVIRMGEYFLQTLTDLTSQHRFLVLYDGTGQLQKIGSQDIRMSLIASVPGDTLVIGGSRGSRSVVVYARTR